MKCFAIFFIRLQWWIAILCILLKANDSLCIVFFNEDDSQTLLLSPNQTESISIISSNRNTEITLSYDDPTKQRFIKQSRKINGLNVGLIVFFDNDYPKRSHLYLRNENNLKLRVYIKVLQYDGFKPIPGGCNLEFPVPISPFLRLKIKELNLILEFQKASLGSNFRLIKNRQDCDFSNSKFTYEVYSYYLKENDFSEKEYMLALKRMGDVDSIEAYGTKLENQINQPKTRVEVLAYRGRGVVFNVKVSCLNYKTAYSPVASYDCDLNDTKSCKSYQSWIEVLYLVVCGLLGLIICLDASKSQKLQVLYFGFLSGSIIAYVLASKFPQVKLFSIYLTVLIGGLLISSIWFMIWLNYSYTSLALILSGAHFGFLLTSLILSTKVLGIYQLKHSLTYGILIIIGLLIIPICSIFVDHKKLNTICCSVFCSYMFVIAVEQFFNGSLVYILTNTINTIIYSDLYLMDTNLPFQTIDYFSSSLCFFLTCLSIFLNLFINCDDVHIAGSILESLASFFTFKKLASLKEFKPFAKSKSKKYEEIETVDNREEDISKYNELSRSIIGSLNNLDKENEICNTSFNSNSRYSSPLIKRRVANSSSTKIDFPATPTTSRCSTPRYSASSQCSTPRLNQRDRLDHHLDYLNQSIGTPNNLLKNVVIQNARYSASSNKTRY